MYDEELFKDWLDERVKRHGKKINTERSVSMARNKLEHWGEVGYDCNAIIRHAIEMGWRGLFLPKGFEPKRQPLKAKGPLFDQAKDLAKKMEMPKPSNPKRQQAAREAFLQVMREQGVTS